MYKRSAQNILLELFNKGEEKKKIIKGAGFITFSLWILLKG